MSCPSNGPACHVVHNHRERRELRAEFSYDDRRSDVIVVAGNFDEIRGRMFSEAYFHNGSDMFNERHQCDRPTFRAWVEELVQHMTRR